MTEGIWDRVVKLDAGQRSAFFEELRQVRIPIDQVELPRSIETDGSELSIAQQRFWFIHKSDPDSFAYNDIVILRLRGALDVSALKEAFNRLVSENSLLHSGVVEVEGNPQLCSDTNPFRLLELDYSSRGESAASDGAEHLLGGLARPFLLDGTRFVRASLIKLEDQEYLLGIVLNHLIADGFSTGLLYEELAANYTACANNESIEPRVKTPFGGYVMWERLWLASHQVQEQLKFWREYLGDITPLRLPLDHPRPVRLETAGNTVAKILSSTETTAIRKTAQRLGVTVNTLLLSCWQIALSRWCGQDEVVVGTAVTLRERPELQTMFGPLSNNLAIRTKFAHDETIAQALVANFQNCLTCYEHQHVPFEDVLSVLHVARDPGVTPLFQSMYTYHAHSESNVFRVPGLTVEKIFFYKQAARFDLEFIVEDAGDLLRLDIQYRRRLFDESTINRLMEAVGGVVQASIDRPEAKLCELELFSEIDPQLLIANSSPTTLPQSIPKAVLAAIELGAPLPIGGAGDSGSLTPAQIADLSHRVASYLVSHGVQRGDRVGILVDRKPELIPALLGTMLCGAAYVPLDPTYPQDWLDYVIADAGLSLILKDTAYQVTVPGELTAELVDVLDAPSTKVEVHTTAEDIAYVIYTSGSTGRPKGVQIPHRAAVNLLEGMLDEPGLSKDDVFLAVTTLSFDISVLELFAPLLAGGRLVIASREQASDGEALAQLIADHGITVMQATPSTWRMMLDAGWRAPNGFKALCGGEPLPADLAEALLSQGLSLWNMYGPTETTVWSTVAHITDSTNIHIGHPIRNTELYILDDQLHRVPLGVPGELFIGGAGLAIGYLDRAELSEERFIAHPFKAGERLYRTGDLVRLASTGELRHLGRLDHQVKIRGFRVELGQIESTLLLHDAVDDVVVHAKQFETGDQRLIAYVASRATLTAHELRSHLQQSLPDYMVPQFFVTMVELPRTPNGKVDRHALPEPNEVNSGLEYAAPEGEIETQIAEVWAELIGIERVGRHDNFFAIGGHSLLLTRVANRVQQVLDRQLPLRELFTEPTIAQWAALFTDSDQEALAPLTAIDRSTFWDGTSWRVPATASQRALWFICQTNPDQHAYDIPVAFELRGELNTDRLAKAVDTLIDHHEVLRTTFSDDGDQLWQLISPERNTGLEMINVSQEALRQTVDAWLATTMSITDGPLFEARLFSLDSTHHVLGLRIHHIIADQQTLQNIVDKISEMYNRVAIDDRNNGIDFVDYAIWSESKSDEYFSSKLQPWTDRIVEPVGCIDLPTDYPRPKQQSFSGEQFTYDLADTLVNEARSLSAARGASLFTTLLAVYGITLSRYSRASDLIVGVPFSNRTVDDRLQHTLGLFVNTLPVPIAVTKENNFDAILVSTQKALREIQASQDVPLERILNVVPVIRDASYNPLFQVGFSLQPAPVSANFSDIEASVFSAYPKGASYDMHWWLLEDPQGRIRIELLYDNALYRRDTIAQIVAQYEKMLELCIASPAITVSQHDVVTRREIARLESLNETDVSGSGELLVTTLLRNSLEASADQTLQGEGRTLNGADAIEFAQRVKNALLATGIQPGERVGVMMHRTPELIPVLLGIMSSGAAYVPLDPTYPAELLDYIAADAGLTRICIHETLLSQRPALDVLVPLTIEEMWSADPGNTRTPVPDPESAAYVIYTSGSTGRPKGVQIPHRAAVNLLEGMLDEPGLSKDDVFLAVTTLSFDISVLELFAPLLAGGRLVIASREQASDGEALAQLIADHGITVMQATPSTWRMMLDAGWRAPNGFKALCGGEPLPADLAEALLSQGLSLWNMYGPTETTVWSTVAHITDSTNIHIGHPIRNTELYILDDQLHRVPLGVPGELFIGGAGLAIGYLDRAELSEERFIAHPFKAGERLYRTGDLVRLASTGELRHLGRLDHQVKIRGFRVELGQIESTLLLHDAVDDVVVHAKQFETGDQRLIAYVASRATLTAHELRSHLQQSLPDYMVPQFFVTMVELPRTPNGKVDRHALPEPNEVNSGLEYAAPEGEIETQIAEVWAELIGIERVGRHDNFFAIGGHSLLLTRVANRVQQVLDRQLPLRELFTEPTIAQWAALFTDSDQEALAPLTAIDRSTFWDGTSWRVPATASQRALWFICQTNPDQHAYDIPVAFELRGELNTDRLAKAVDTLIDHHEVLRTTFSDDGDQLWQLISPERNTGLEMINVSQEALRQTVDAWLATTMSITDGPLFEARLFSLDSTHHVLGLRIHHIISDQQTLSLLTNNLSQLYEGHDLLDGAFDFADYAIWSEARNSTRQKEAALKPWTDRIVEPVGCIDLPTDYPRPKRQSFFGQREIGRIDTSLANNLRAFSKDQRMSLFSTLLAGFGVLLQKYTRTKELVVGVPFTNRTASPELDQVAGIFINTLPIFLDIDPDESFSAAADYVRTVQAEVQARQDTPLERIMEVVPVIRDASYNPLFQVGLSLQPMHEVIKLPGIESTPYDAFPKSSIYDMHWWLLEDDDGSLLIDIWYDDQLFKAETIQQFIAHYQRLLFASLAKPELPINQHDIVTVEEVSRLENLNATDSSGADEPLITATLMDAMEGRGKDLVLTGEVGTSLMASQVIENAHRVASYLVSHGVQRGDRVGILVDRKPELIPALLGTMLCGAAYVPLDPTYPQDWLDYVIADAGLSLILKDTAYQVTVPGELTAELVDVLDAPSTKVEVHTTAEDIAYVIYTSGSTGRPKGVQIPHRAAVNLLEGMLDEPGLSKDDVFLAVTTLSFDISVLELFAPLLAGGRLVIASREQASDGEALAQLIADHGITVMQATPSTWRMMLDAGWRAPNGFKALCGGEPLPADLAEALLSQGLSLWNMYGPTETTVWSTVAHITDPSNIHIGHPIRNTELYILDDQLHRVPLGVPGELFIGGAGLAIGYLDRAELSEERFIAHPFKAGERLYRTGDLVRLASTGELRHLGRLDHQVKIRGFRVELGQIESTLLLHDAVDDVVVHAKQFETGDQRLIAYVASRATLTAHELRSHLQQSLPDYMVPQFFVTMVELPRTPNGKVDRHALPEPNEVNSGLEYAAPEGEIETQIAEVWAELIGIERVGRHDNFFAIGGHSLLLTRVANRVQQVLDRQLPLRELFTEPTIAQWAALFTDSDQEALAPLTAIDRSTFWDGTSWRVPATASQRALWFICQTNPDQHAYDIPVAFELRGELNTDRLAKAVDTLIDHHEVLRTTFSDDGDQLWQLISPERNTGLEMINVSQEALRQTVDAWLATTMSITDGPLFEARLFSLDSTHHVLGLRIHHIISDQQTLSLLTNNLSQLYEGHDLLDGAFDFADYAIWSEARNSTRQKEAALKPWTDRIVEPVGCIDLPTDYPRPKRQSFFGQREIGRIDTSLANNLRAFSKDQRMSLFSTLLAGFGVLLQKYTRTKELVVGVPFTNRTASPELDQVAGIFINTLPIFLDIDPDESFSAAADYVRTVQAEVQARQDTPLERIMEVVPVIRDASYNPLFQVGLSLQPMHEVIKLPGIESTPYDAFPKSSIYDMHWWLLEDDDGSLLIDIWYDDQLFKAETIQQFIAHYQRLLFASLAKPELPINQHDIVTVEEVSRLENLNATDSSGADEPLITATLMDAMEGRGKDLVLTGEVGTSLMASQVIENAHRVASYLVSHGVQRGDRVGILVDRKPELIPALLGTMLCGAAYVPLDPTYPQDWLDYVIADAGLSLILKDTAYQVTVPGELTAELVDVLDAPSTKVEVHTTAEDIAYVIYTSGSTGRPKGVQIPHRAAVNLLEGMLDEPGLSKDDVFLAVTTLSFDISVLELFAPLLAGGRLVIASREQASDGEALAQLIADHGITVMQATPSTWRMMLDAGWRAPNGFKALCGGEPLPADLAEALLSQGLSLWNMYGPTETTVWSTVAHITDSTNIHIGHPIRNTELYILDDQLHRVPLGVPGELFIGGAGLAIGYLDRAELSEERFIAHPFKAGERLYRTGDLVRLASTGELRHLGRLDHQVKIRGFRVELGQIESTLLLHDAVDDVVVHAKQFETGDQRLIAYVASRATLTAHELRSHLQQSLPDYMVPQFFVTMVELPRTPNGKVDRHALPEPNEVNSGLEYAAPEGEIETQIAEVWAELIGIERVGRHDNFFAIGGHSLLLTRVANRVQQVLDRQLPLRELFTEPTIAQWAALFTDSDQEALAPLTAIDRSTFWDGTSWRVPATASQRALWFICQTNPDQHAYDIPVAFELRGELNTDRLAKAVDTLIDHHEVLRTTFSDDGDQLWQLISPERNTGLEMINVSQEALRQTVDAWLATTMSITDGPLFEARLFSLDSTHHVLGLRIHHIISDQQTLSLLTNNLSQLYEGHDLLDGAFDFADYAIWSEARNSTRQKEAALKPWTDRIVEPVGCIDLPTDYPRPKRQSFFGQREIGRIDTSLANNLRAFSKDQRMSLFSTLLAGFGVLLQKYTRTKELVVGVPFTNRTASPELDQVAGIFINTLPIFLDIDPDESFSAAADYVRTVQAEVQARQDTPLERIMEVVPVIRDASYNPLFQVGLSLQPMHEVIKLPGIESTPYDAFPKSSIYDMHWWLLEDDDGSLLIDIWYDDQLFKAETIQQFIAHYQRLLFASLAKPELPINQHDIVTVEEVSRLENLNATDSSGADEPLITATLMDAMEGRGKDLVLTGEVGTSLMASQVIENAHRVASYLVSHGVQRGDRVGILVDRKPELIPALLGTMLCGAAYVPLDPTYPQDWLDYVIADAGLSLILKDTAYQVTVPGELTAELVDVLDAPSTKVEVHTTAEDIAYVIYTSGSTGRPKGVQIPHRAAVNLLEGMLDEPGLSKDDVFLAVTTLSFDISVLELFAPLLAGGRLVIASREQASDGEALAQLIADHGITVMQATPSTWRMMLDAGWRAPNGFKALCGGEPLPADLAEALLSQGLSLWNMYGPTETTVWSTVAHITDPSNIHIGHPIRNTELYILDDQLHRVPLGVPGELFIGGAGLAIGYLDRAELSEERFIAHPFKAGERLYRTGDLVRLASTGELRHLGRLDHQVKIRGFRVELGQIESTLLLHDAVDDVVVHAKQFETGDQRLIAYVASRATLTAHELRSHLQQSLPDYMVPQFFVTMVELPRTPNGKVDRHALPEPNEVNSGLEYAAPEGEIETQIAEVWAELIGIERVGRHDNFFAIGGHSLLLTRVANRVQQVLDRQLPLRELFTEPTIAQWAALLNHRPAEDEYMDLLSVPITPGVTLDQDQLYPATHAQRQMWYVAQANPESKAFHLVRAARIEGPFSQQHLEQALLETIEHHAALRTSFVEEKGAIYQRIAGHSLFELNRQDLEEEAEIEKRLLEVLLQPFDLGAGPLVRACLITSSVGYTFGICAHHLIVDQHALSNVIDEVQERYAAAQHGDEYTGTPLELEFADFAVWHERVYGGDIDDAVLGQLTQPWTSRIKEVVGCINLPNDLPRPKIQSFSGQRCNAEISVDVASQLRDFSHAKSVSLFSTLLTAFSTVLHYYTRQEDVLVGVPFSNRELDDRLENVTGLFVNTLPVPCHVSPDVSFEATLKTIHQTLMEVHARQALPLERLFNGLSIERDTAFNPLYQVALSMQPLADEMSFAATQTQEFVLSTRASMLDLQGWVLEDPNGALVIDLWYDDHLFKKETVQQLLDQYVKLLELCAESPTTLIREFSVITPGERARFDDWNDTRSPALYSSDFVSLIADSLITHSKHVVVSGSDGTLTGGQVIARAAAVAQALKEQGVRHGDRIGVLMERRVDLVPTLLGVLSVGAVYAPLDPAYPEDLLSYIVEDAGLELLVVHRRVSDRSPSAKEKRLIVIDELDIDESVTRLRSDSQLDDLAYVIYTSGSTGRPKGVQITRNAVTNLLKSMIAKPGLSQNDVFLAVTTLSFDISVLEIFGTLLTGAHLVVATRDEAMDGRALIDLQQRQRVSAMQATPSSWRMLIDAGWDPEPGFKVWCGGEAMPRDLVQDLLDRDVELWNMYGPTETTVWSAVAQIESADDIHIGGPIDNTEFYVVDPHYQHVPIGVPGELLIGGIGLADGYLNRPDLTEKQFIRNPFSSDGVLYKTGDLVRYTHEGKLRHLGRIDHQVKIRGFRIELGQIEAVLLNHPNVSETVVYAKEVSEGDRRLIAYVVDKEGKGISAGELRRFTRSHLPDYMVPQFFIVLPNMPRTPNGKVDRNQLPQPSNVELAGKYDPPKSEAEKLIAAKWEAVLGVQQVGRYDNFFAIGGHSLLAIKLISTLRDEVGAEIKLQDLLSLTLKDLAGTLDLQNQSSYRSANAKGNASWVSRLRKHFWGSKNRA